WLLLSLFACSPSSDPAGEDPAGDGSSDPSAGDTEAPCTPLAAVFFDLGETLATERDDGLFEERPGVTDLLVQLQDSGRPIGLITNVPAGYDDDDLRALLVDPSLLDRFDVLLLSSEAASDPKPDPAIFVEAVGLLADPPPIETTAFVTEELAMIGNGRPPSEGARAAGMIGVHLTDEPPSPLADHTVAVRDLPSLADAPWVACIEAESTP
ncbi:MAG: HAD family hydrolase, partial [Deltaproteobacteria bacterium]|nr:HAD family hydrolase [Deltaproteobacteria bacterium]